MSAALEIDDIADVQAEYAAALARQKFWRFCNVALEYTPYPNPAAHQRLMISELQDVADGKTKRLMMLLPPGSAKSTYASKLFPAWRLLRSPRLSIIGASNTATLAEQFSRDVQGYVREHGAEHDVGMVRESAELWSTSNGGQYRAAGVGGIITGFRADLGLIDDPIKSQEEADSETIRNKQWNWYQNDFLTRLRPGAAIVLCMTHWHEDDLAGRLLATQPDSWRVIRIPARAEENDQLGRSPGEWLWDDDGYGYGALLRSTYAECQRDGETRKWSALYQQDPRPAEGLLFTGPMPLWSEAVPAGQRVRSWDLAATDGGGDWTAGVLMRRTACARYVVEDVKRVQLPPEGVEALIMRTAAEDGKSVTIRLPEDPGQAGKSQSLYFTRRLEGYRVECVRETGDKATRATPLASQCNVGNLFLIEAPWNRVFREEMRGFPAAAHDDQVDAASGAFAVLTATPKPARPVNLNFMGR